MVVAVCQLVPACVSNGRVVSHKAINSNSVDFEEQMSFNDFAKSLAFKEPLNGGFANMMGQFQQFKQNFSGDPKAQVQQLLEKL